MSDKLHKVTILDEDRISLIEFAQRQFEEKIRFQDFGNLVAQAKEPVVMMSRFRIDIRQLSVSLVIKQEKTGHWVRYAKMWINNEPVGNLPDPTTVLEVCRLLGFTGGDEELQIKLEQGRQFYYANVAQVILPGTHANIIQVTHNNPKEEEFGRTPGL